MGTGLCRMGILAIVIVTIPESFRIIICHRSNSNSESFFFLLSILHPFNVFIYLYFVVFLTFFQCFYLIVFCCFFSHFFQCFCLFVFCCFSHIFSMLLFICILLWTYLMNWTFIFNIFDYLYLVVNLSNELDFYWHFAYQIKNVKTILMKQKMTYNEIYKTSSFKKTKLITTKLLCSTKEII